MDSPIIQILLSGKELSFRFLTFALYNRNEKSFRDQHLLPSFQQMSHSKGAYSNSFTPTGLTKSTEMLLDAQGCGPVFGFVTD